MVQIMRLILQTTSFYFHSGEEASSVVQGFTITNGLAFHDYGGGMLIDDSNPMVTD